jgi:hypothetical protein
MITIGEKGSGSGRREKDDDEEMRRMREEAEIECEEGKRKVGMHGTRIRNRDKIESGGQNLVSNAQLQDPLMLTGMRDLYNYVDAFPGRFCWKDTGDGSRRA